MIKQKKNAENFDPQDSKWARGINVTAVYVEDPKGLKIGSSPDGKSKKMPGAWTVGFTVDTESPVGGRRFSHYYNPSAWPTKSKDAHFFDDFEFMMQFLAKRKIIVTSQSYIRYVCRPLEEMWMMVVGGQIHRTWQHEPSTQELDAYLQENFLLTYRLFNSITFIKVIN